MFEQPFPESFRPHGATGVAGVNRIRLPRDWPDNGIRIEDQTRFGSLLDHLDDPRVFAPKRRSNPDARSVPDNLDEARHCIGSSPRVGQGDFVGSQSNDHEVGVIVAHEPREFAVPGGRVGRLGSPNFVQSANRLHFRPQSLGKPSHDKRIAHVQHDRFRFDR